MHVYMYQHTMLIHTDYYILNNVEYTNGKLTMQTISKMLFSLGIFSSQKNKETIGSHLLICFFCGHLMASSV